MGLDVGLLKGLTVALLLALCGGRRCDYRKISSDHRNIFLVDLQQHLNLTGSLNLSKEKDQCPLRKAHHIVRSIYSAVQKVRCHGGKRPEREEERLVESMESMEDSLRRHCGQTLIKKEEVCPVRARGRRRRRRLLLKLIRALVHCWQKLQVVISQTLLKD